MSYNRFLILRKKYFEVFKLRYEPNKINKKINKNKKVESYFNKIANGGIHSSLLRYSIKNNETLEILPSVCHEV
jgi:hypothetical protein